MFELFELEPGSFTSLVQNKQAKKSIFVTQEVQIEPFLILFAMIQGVQAPKTALGLYRALFRYSQTLTLTDPDFFRRRVRQEFRDSKQITDKEEAARRIRKAQILLEKKAFV